MRERERKCYMQPARSSDVMGVSGELMLYPEMISPEQTLQLVQSVLRRSQELTEEEWRNIYVRNKAGMME
jgi:hypothetical protein